MIKMKPSDYMLKSMCAVVFIAVGVFYAFQNIKAIYKMVKEETEEPSEVNQEEIAETPQFEKPQHDKTMFRTAPMPTEEEILNGMKAETETEIEETETQETETQETETQEIESDYEEK